MKTKDEFINEIVELAENNCFGHIDTHSLERDLDFLLAEYEIVRNPADLS